MQEWQWHDDVVCLSKIIDNSNTENIRDDVSRERQKIHFFYNPHTNYFWSIRGTRSNVVTLAPIPNKCMKKAVIKVPRIIVRTHNGLRNNSSEYRVDKCDTVGHH